MKPSRFLIALLATIISVSVQAQLKKNSYRVRIELLNGKNVRGYLTALNDSSIQIRRASTEKVDTLFTVSSIKNLSIRRKNSGGHGFLVGLGVGAGLGALIGYASYSPPDCDGQFICIDFGPGLDTLAGAIAGGLSGGLLGLITGSLYRKIAINGDFALYNQFRKKIFKGKRALR